jgi:hypothetical protein
VQRAEFEAVANTLIRRYRVKGTNPYAMERSFYLTGHPSISSGEVFFREGLKRAYDCRGTPEEIRDAVRLAVAAERCDASTAAAYATKWFGLDCNTLVGNWLGLSSGTAIFAYVVGYGKGKLAGGTPADEATRGMLPLPPATTLDSVEEGSVLVTYSPKNSGMKVWEHIALVQSFALTGATDLNHGTVQMSIVEWGEKGGESAHIKTNITANAVKGNFVKERPQQAFWAIPSGDSYRLLLNMTPEISQGVRRKYGVLNDQTL